MNNFADLEYKPFFLLPSLKDRYYEVIESGIEHLANKKICIVGIVRDVGVRLETAVTDLERLFKKASNDVAFFIYENDSIDDDTKIKLKELKNKIHNFDYLSETKKMQKFGSVKSKERTDNLAVCRNICLDYVKKNYSEYDYTIVIDLDYYYYDMDGLLHSFGLLHQNPEIDGMAGVSYEIKHQKYKDPNPENSSGFISLPYLWNYDSWAFRLNIWEDLQLYYKAYHRDPMTWFGLWQPPIGSDIVSVYSAFGGSCIYKTNEFIKGRYSGGDCEHVNFHKSLEEHNFSLYLNPSQFMVFK